MISHPKTALAGPKLLNTDGTLQPSCYKFPTPLRCIWENTLLTAAFPNSTIFGDYRAWAHDSTRDVDFVIGAAMLVRRRVIEQIGLFDPLFFMYSEETDWQKRIASAGGKVSFCPDAVITHIGGQSSLTMRNEQFCEFQKSKAKWIKKHYGAIGAIVQKMAMIEGSLLRIALWSIIGCVSPAKQSTATLQVSEWLRISNGG